MKYHRIYKRAQKVIAYIEGDKTKKLIKHWNILRLYIIKILITEDIEFRESSVAHYYEQHKPLQNDKIKEVLLNHLRYCSDRFLSWERVFCADFFLIEFLQSSCTKE